MTKALAFNGVQFDSITRGNQVWIRSPQIAGALEYSRADRIYDIYSRHADEFTPSMTQVVKLKTEGGMQDVRIFSLRGCHLLAMFARTPVAKAFRKWVLDILDSMAESSKETAGGTITPDQQCTLQNIVRAKVEAMPEEQRRGGFPAIWSRFNNHFRLAKYNQLPQERMAEAISYLMALKIPAPAIEAPKPHDDDNRSDFYKCLGEYVNGFGEMVDEVHKKLTSRGNYFSMLMHIDRQARNMELRGMDNMMVQTLHDYTYMATCGANMLLRAIDGFNHMKHACNFR